MKILFREKIQHHNRKDRSKGTPKLGPYRKLQPVICTVNMEWRSEFGLWIGTTVTFWSFLVDQKGLWWIWTTTKQILDQLEEYALKLSAKDFVGRSETKRNKTTKKRSWWLFTNIVPMERGNLIDIEPWKHSLSEYEVSKKVIHLLRHSQSTSRRWRGSFLVKKWKSSEAISTMYSWVWRSMEIVFAYWMCVWSSFYYQQWINIWIEILSDSIECNHPSNTPAYCIPKVVRLILEKGFTKKYICHLDLRQRSHWSANGQGNFFQNMLNDQKLRNYLEVSNLVATW